MTSFGWKRKAGEKVSKVASQNFEAAAVDEGLVDADVDWLPITKRQRKALLEDCTVKSKRLKEEGIFLSENGRYWEAIGRWDEAIQLMPDCAALYEMKAQALRSFQRALHMCPGESSLWEDDLAWALELRRSQRQLVEADIADKGAQRQEAGKQLPEYDFESDELVEACAAIAEKDRHPVVTRTTVFITASQGAESVTQTASRPRQGDRGFIQAR
ncbi:tetratricopeptide repeat protein 33 isoform X2 [Heterodontus francisci]|uniref:tetratricopeptide repeat protein 33 isoform X2 n=1 Tax=Heterodontus francisci TaxID=7792 RepID=UPI00355C9A94